MLSDLEILEEIRKGNIVIEPFDKRQLGSNSYDVRLGRFIARKHQDLRILDVFNEEDIKSYWQIREVTGGTLTVFPNETILCHTEEIVGGQNYITTRMNARSSIMRCGISVCKCAGIGDCGFVSRWTMELTNHLEVPVALKIGMRIAQISFERIGEVSEQYHGKYQTNKWQPEDMLPKLWLDWDI